MKVKDIIQTDKFNEFLGYEIEAYNNRPALEEGKVYRRTPYDSLKEAGSFTVEGVRDEFTRVANYESRLPKVQRDAITGLVFRVAQTVVNYFAQEEAKKQAQEEPKAETECTNTNSYGKNEYREGCKQDCEKCEYNQPKDK